MIEQIGDAMPGAQYNRQFIPLSLTHPPFPGKTSQIKGHLRPKLILTFFENEKVAQIECRGSGDLGSP